MIDQTARDRILERLKSSGTHLTTVPDTVMPAPPNPLDQDAKRERLETLMTAMRTEIHVVASADWVDKLTELARAKGWKQLIYGPQGPLGNAIETAWGASPDGLPALVAYQEPVEAFKADLFQIDVGVTSTRGAVADTGAIVLWPTAQEPRLLSLVPGVHVAVLDEDKIHDSLTAMMAAENWATSMPTNALLISGPSKTADIEFTLVFGVHGPEELILLIRR
jgi:L-lactate dehydrogenase complex protein LldG